MSTRSIIVITGVSSLFYRNDNQKTVRLYKHSDGYPTGNLEIIAEALKASTKECKGEVPEKLERGMPVDLMVGKTIGAATSVYGMGARIDTYEAMGTEPAESGEFEGPLTKDHLGIQGDLEWIYVVDLPRKSVDVYAGTPDTVTLGETTDPLTYIKQLRDECQEREAEKTRFLMAQIERTGFKVNRPAKLAAVPTAPAVKRGRGRPRKTPIVNLVELMNKKSKAK